MAKKKRKKTDKSDFLLKIALASIQLEMLKILVDFGNDVLELIKEIIEIFQ